MKNIRGDKSNGIIIHAYMEISQRSSLSSYLYLKQAKMLCFSFYFFCFFSTKLENKTAEQVLLNGESWHQWEWGGVGERG
jgi:hypothetical protein